MVAMTYPASVAEADDGVTVTFRDIPEAITGAEMLVDAFSLARDALSVALEVRLENRDPIPAPSAPRGSNEILVSPPARVAAKALILHLMQREGVKAVTLAERMGVPASEINRILDPRHRTGLDRLEAAITMLGGELRIATQIRGERPSVDLPALSSGRITAVDEIMADARRRIIEAMGALDLPSGGQRQGGRAKRRA